MLGRFAIVLFAASFLSALLASDLSAQGRGGFHRGAGSINTAPPMASARPGFVFRSPSSAARPIFRGPHIGGFGRFPHRTVIVTQPFIGGYAPLFGPLPIYTPPLYADQQYFAPSVSDNEVELAYEVQRLSQEIQQLRQQQTMTVLRQPAPPPPPSAPPSPAVPTTLVFRDGHRMDIQNYAIVGQTMWVLDENSSIKISLDELDLQATEKENRSKGVRFLLPPR